MSLKVKCVGLAAVHIAGLCGAEVFATCSASDAKRQHLRALGVQHGQDWTREIGPGGLFSNMQLHSPPPLGPLHSIYAPFFSKA